ncbi:hypothetical protein VTH06DRAFT_7946, partial [Thermothelomyces fergusii]
MESPFDLPLRRDSDTLDTWLELKQAYLAKLAPSADESTLDQEELGSCVEAWKGAIREKQSANPAWMTQWLRSYGPALFGVLSDAQLAAVLDAAYDPERLDCWRQKPDLLLATKLCPARAFYCRNYPPSDRKAARDRLRTSLTETYEDGEVRRYGAGESYRPFNRDRDRSPPPRIRSPLRDRGRSPLPVTSDSYVPARSPLRDPGRQAEVALAVRQRPLAASPRPITAQTLAAAAAGLAWGRHVSPPLSEPRLAGPRRSLRRAFVSTLVPAAAAPGLCTLVGAAFTARVGPAGSRHPKASSPACATAGTAACSQSSHSESPGGRRQPDPDQVSSEGSRSAQGAAHRACGNEELHITNSTSRCPFTSPSPFWPERAFSPRCHEPHGAPSRTPRLCSASSPELRGRGGARGSWS